MNHHVLFDQAESDTDISMMKDGDKFSKTVKFIICQDPISFLQKKINITPSSLIYLMP